IDGENWRKSFIENIVKREYSLQSIVPNEEVLSHVFLGFTQDGQYLLSYCFESQLMFIYIWNFNYHKPLTLLAKHSVFSGSRLVDDLYESTGVYIYQWPSNDKHILVLTIPEHPFPSVINLIVIYFDQKQSYVLTPGIITYGVVGWGHRHQFFDQRVNKCFEEYLTPGMLLFRKSICAFTTGTEIVCLKIEHSQSERSAIIANVLDIEKVLVETLENDKSNNSIRLLTYELLVCGLEFTPTTVFAFVHAVIRDAWKFQSFKEFVVQWDIDKNDYVISECDIVVKENNTRKACVQLVLEHINSQESSAIYFLDNMQFIESQTSMESLKSPVDSVYVKLSLHCN
ncbi:hypothetical protein B4U79_04641, partial [Dinothrombium tinctorium]